jgi:RNA polymerase sigma factor (sigma-70 family)
LRKILVTPRLFLSRGSWQLKPHLVSILRHLRRVVVRHGDGGLDDAQLLERFASQRDEAAFEVLVWRHGPMVLGVGRRVLDNRHDAEDVLQATFLALVRHARSIGKRQALGAWLHKVAYRAALRAKSQLRFRAAETLSDLPAPQSLVRNSQHDALALLDEELQRLPAKYRTPLVLSYLQGLSNREVAAELGCPIGTVFTRLARGRDMLRSRLLRRGVTLSPAALTGVLVESAPAGVLSSELAQATVRAALAYAEGAAAVSPHVAALTEGVLKMLWLSKVKLIAAALLLLTVAGSGAGLLTFRVNARVQDDEKQGAAENQPAPQKRRPPREALRYSGKSFDEWRTALLTELSPDVRAEGIKAITAFGKNGYGKEAVAAIVDVMSGYDVQDLTDDQKVIDAATLGVAKIGEDALPMLLEELKKGKPNSRLFAAHCLPFFGAKARAAIPDLAKALKDSNAFVRRQALSALHSIDDKGESVRSVSACLTDEDVMVRQAAIYTLEHFVRSKVKEAIPPLLKASTTDKSSDNRRAALDILNRLQLAPSVVLPAFREALKDTDPNNRRVVLDYLTNLAPGAAQPAVTGLIEALRKPDRTDERPSIIHLLGQIGPGAKDAIPVLTELLLAEQKEAGGKAYLKDGIVDALGKINK